MESRESRQTQESRPLGSTGVSVSRLGFGGATLGDEYGRIDEREAERSVHLAIERGVDFIDVAPYYGRTLAEERLGRILEGKRDRVFLATKCCRDGRRRFDFSAERVNRSLEESLERLRTDVIDLFQVHDVEFGRAEQILEETLPALESAKRAGKIRFLGITGLPVGMLRDLASQHPVDTVLSYCHHNLLVDDLEEVLGELARERGFGLINASPLHMGVLTEGGPQDWHPAPKEIVELGRTIAALCRDRGRSVAEVALRYCLDRDVAATTLVGMATREQVEDNLRALSTPNDPDLMAEIAELVHPLRNRTWHEGLPENAPAT